MKKPPTIFAVSSFALLLFTGCGKKEDPVKIVEQAEAKLPPAEQMPPDAGRGGPLRSPAPASTSDAAFLAATSDKALHHEAEVEHAGAKKLIAEIEDANSSDDYFEAKVKVLSEMIKHHVNEEEQPGGMFAEARKSEMDLLSVGRELKARKEQLEG